MWPTADLRLSYRRNKNNSNAADVAWTSEALATTVLNTAPRDSPPPPNRRGTGKRRLPLAQDDWPPGSSILAEWVKHAHSAWRSLLSKSEPPAGVDRCTKEFDHLERQHRQVLGEGVGHRGAVVLAANARRLRARGVDGGSGGGARSRNRPLLPLASRGPLDLLPIDAVDGMTKEVRLPSIGGASLLQSTLGERRRQREKCRSGRLAIN